MFEAPTSTDIAAGSTPTKGLSRRQLVKAGVWAAPVVVLATASPAAAVSVTGLTLTATNVLNNGGQRTANWNLSLNVVGTDSTKVWTLSVIKTGAAGVTWTTAFPTTVSSAGVIAAALTTTGSNGASATITVTLTNGTTVITSNTVPVTKH
jgi:hypothetical protein